MSSHVCNKLVADPGLLESRQMLIGNNELTEPRVDDQTDAAETRLSDSQLETNRPERRDRRSRRERRPRRERQRTRGTNRRPRNDADRVNDRRPVESDDISIVDMMPVDGTPTDGTPINGTPTEPNSLPPTDAPDTLEDSVPSLPTDSAATRDATPDAPVELQADDRPAIFFDEGPSTGDTINASQRARQRAIEINDPNSNYLGLVAAGDSLFATVPTIESFAFAESVFDAAEGTREAGLFEGEEALDDDEVDEIARSFIQGDLTEPLQALAGVSFSNSVNLALNELDDDQTLSSQRVQQIENNATARIAQGLGAASFVNNSIGDDAADDSGDVVLTFNPANPEIDGGPAASNQAEREPRNFSLEEITTNRFSINDFRSGDTITLPANIGNEAARLRSESAQRNVETTVGFTPDGSTFASPALIESLAEPIEVNPEATPLGDGATFAGVFDGVTPLIELAEFSGGTENNIADLHTHPPRVFAFEVIAENGGTAAMGPAQISPGPDALAAAGIIGVSPIGANSPPNVDSDSSEPDFAPASKSSNKAADCGFSCEAIDAGIATEIDRKTSPTVSLDPLLDDADASPVTDTVVIDDTVDTSDAAESPAVCEIAEPMSVEEGESGEGAGGVVGEMVDEDVGESVGQSDEDDPALLAFVAEAVEGISSSAFSLSAEDFPEIQQTGDGISFDTAGVSFDSSDVEEIETIPFPSEPAL